MSKNRRILFEALAPPFLGAFIFMVTGSGSDTLADRVFYFLPFVLMAYAFCIIPSFLYMLVMELWFWLGLRARCGLLCTVLLSAFLGCGAGLVIEYVIDFHQILSTNFLWIGSLVGLLIGFYVSKQKTSSPNQIK
jgi:hypothetical protein